MISKARALIQSVMTRYYRVHHNVDTFENELVDEIGSARVRAFASTKRQVLEALDYRLARLNDSLEVLQKNREKFESNYLFDDMESRIDELETFRNYVKGMVIKVEE